MTEEIKNILVEAKKNRQTIREIIRKIKKMNPRKLDEAFHMSHDEVFQQIDCLDCANCCSSISPTLYHKDIDRLAASMRTKPGKFSEEFLLVDDEDDYIFKQTPCPFLMNDNYCLHYESRPKACREYPHTDRKRMRQILSLTEKNALVCPAVYRIIRNIHQQV